MHKKKWPKIAIGVLLVIALTCFLSGAVLATWTGSPTNWDGNGPNPNTCPHNTSWHWILTTGGGEFSGVVLDGTYSDGSTFHSTMTEHGNGSWTATLEGPPLANIASAAASYTVVDAPNGNVNLTISSATCLVPEEPTYIIDVVKYVRGEDLPADASADDFGASCNGGSAQSFAVGSDPLTGGTQFILPGPGTYTITDVGANADWDVSYPEGGNVVVLDEENPEGLVVIVNTYDPETTPTTETPPTTDTPPTTEPPTTPTTQRTTPPVSGESSTQQILWIALIVLGCVAFMGAGGVIIYGTQKH